MKYFYVCLIVYIGLLTTISCKKTNNNTDSPSPIIVPTKIDSTVSAPTGIIVKPGYRLDTISWNKNNEKNLSGYKIYRDTIPSPSKLIATLSTATNSYLDTGLKINKKYYYLISAYNTYNKEGKTAGDVVTNSVILGQIGGLHYVNWSFPTNTFKNLQHTVTIKNMPTNWDGTPNNDGLYFQMYNAFINDTIQFYYGFQTSLQGKKGFIFSRFSTRDLSNVIIPTGGWSESAGYEGNFVGVRKWYDWGTGSYQVTLNLDSTDHVGDWYSVYVKNLQTNAIDYMGSLRFETSSNSTGIKSGFGTWTELYAKDQLNPNTPLPNWNISVVKVLADGNLPVHASSLYSEDAYGAVRMPTNISSTNKVVLFDMGYDAMRLNSKGNLW